MDEIKPCHDGFCRDGSFTVIFCPVDGQVKVLLGQRSDDSLWEYLGGGFDLRDFNPRTAVIREIKEEAGLYLNGEREITYFAHMTQRLPSKFGQDEKGHAFYFIYEAESDLLSREFPTSDEHIKIGWHTVDEILSGGEKFYKTAALRITLRFLMYLENQKFQFGLLADQVEFNGHKF